MAKTITITISDTDENILKNDILDSEIWIKEALTGKINNCFKRMKNNWTSKFIDDENFSDPIESDKDKFVAQVLAHADYKDRATKEAEAKA